MVCTLSYLVRAQRDFTRRLLCIIFLQEIAGRIYMTVLTMLNYVPSALFDILYPSVIKPLR